MKMKYNIAQDILIYILAIITTILALVVINNYVFADYQIVAQKYSLITEHGINIYDDQGENVNPQVIQQYNQLSAVIHNYRKFEIGLVVTVVVIGFGLIIYSISHKLKMITDTLSSGINNLQQLQPITGDCKYQELSEINQTLNTAITNIQDKDRIRNNLYENMIHDFSTPLHILKGNIELMNNGIDIDLNVLNNQIIRLEHLSRMNVAKQQYSYQQLTGQQLLAYIDNLRRIYPKQQLKVNIDPNLTITTAVENFYRIIDNVVNNAIKHGKPKVITITLTTTDEGYKLIIGNDGKPIDKQVISQLFERNNSTTSSGIGLNIVNQICDDLNYQLSVDSNQQTTTFTVKMPKLTTA